jgi:hypothetical protein
MDLRIWPSFGISWGGGGVFEPPLGTPLHTHTHMHGEGVIALATPRDRVQGAAK